MAVESAIVVSHNTMNMKTLHAKFKELGCQRFKLKNELLAMIPEINRTGIWKKYADNIFEYAARYGDLSKTAVAEMLNIAPKLESKPVLKAAVREIGINKVKLVMPLITVENEQEIVEKARDLSVRAIRIWKKEEKGQTPREIEKIELDEEMEYMFLKLKKKFGGCNRDVMKKILRKMMKEEFPTKKTRKSKKSNVTRNLPASKKRDLGDKCSRCNRPAEEYHHEVPYSVSRSHESVVPLCHEHHELAHNGVYGGISNVDRMRRRCRST